MNLSFILNLIIVLLFLMVGFECEREYLDSRQTKLFFDTQGGYGKCPPVEIISGRCSDDNTYSR